MSLHQSEPDRLTLYRCKGDAEWNQMNPEQAKVDPAMTHVLWRCGDAAANVACDCPAITFVEER